MKQENDNQTGYKQAARAGAQTDSHKGHEYPSAGVKRRVNGCTEQRRARINLRRGSREPHKRETGKHSTSSWTRVPDCTTAKQASIVSYDGCRQHVNRDKEHCEH
jgi:hypothetical protein